MIETLSAPAFNKSRISASERTPPPTVNGMKTVSAVRVTTSSRIPRPSWLAVISRKVISSASWASYICATSTGVARVDVVDVLYALHDAALVDVQAGDDPLQEHESFSNTRPISTAPV